MRIWVSRQSRSKYQHTSGINSRQKMVHSSSVAFNGYGRTKFLVQFESKWRQTRSLRFQKNRSCRNSRILKRSQSIANFLQVRTHIPDMMGWTKWYYTKISKLVAHFVRRSAILCSRNVVQQSTLSNAFYYTVPSSFLVF